MIVQYKKLIIFISLLLSACDINNNRCYVEVTITEVGECTENVATMFTTGKRCNIEYTLNESTFHWFVNGEPKLGDTAFMNCWYNNEDIKCHREVLIKSTDEYYSVCSESLINVIK